MISNLFIFAASLVIVIKGATIATKHAAKLAESFHISKYTVGFIVIALISTLPETFIAISSAVKGIPSFGLGMLFGSNIADMTLVFAAIIFFTGRNLKVEGKILKNHAAYSLILLLPLILGFNGHFSRLEGLALILAGGIFYYNALKNGKKGEPTPHDGKGRHKHIIMLLVSMAILLIGSHFTVTSATALATYFGISPILIGMFVVALGTTMPELLFSLESVEDNEDSIAVGDILGTVLVDATIVVGILALVNPFSFPQKIIYITGTFMVISSFILFRFMRSGRTISKREAFMLLTFWVIFVLVELIANQ